MGIDRCSLVQLPVIADPQGSLAFAEAEEHVPFPVGRVFYVYDVPQSARRGGHAHRELEQAVFCLAGAMEIVVDDGDRRRSFRLEDPSEGLYLPPLVWHDISGFAAGTVYMVLASAPFDESDYIRGYKEYRSAVGVSA